MNNNEFSNIEITENIHKAMDKAIDIGIERASMELKSKKIKKRKIAIGITAACFCLVVTFGATNPALAAKLPIVGSVFEAIEKKIQFPGEYSQYATSVNEVVSDNGINVTLSDILCDGEGLYVTYKVESKESFKYTSRGNKLLDVDQLMTMEAYNKVNFSNKELDNTGFAGLEGKFIDENTFIGMERYYLDSLETEIPDTFDFQVKLTSIGTHGYKKNDKDQNINGTWAFKVPVKVDKSISKNIEVNYKTDNGFSLDSIIITPFNVVINNTNPDHDCYGMKVTTQDNKELNFDRGQIFDDNNKQINYLSALPKDCKSLRVMIYKDILEEKETINHPDGSSETSYEDLGDEILLDKTINIE